MNTDANPFADYEPNTTGGTEDPGGDIDLAGAAGRAARTGSVFGGSDQGIASSQFTPPWPGLGMNPLGPTFRAETQKKTRQFHRCLKKKEERPQLSLKTLRRSS